MNRRSASHESKKMSVQPLRILKDVITQEVAEKAFTKIKSDPRFSLEGCHLELIKESRYEDILNFYRDNYLPDEPIAKSLNLQWDEDIKSMITDILKHNLSLAIVSSKTGEILGSQAVVIANRHDKIDTTQYRSEPLRQYVNLTDHFNSLNNVYDHYKVEDIVFLFHLAVLKKHRQKGIGTTLVSAAVAFVENFNTGPVVLRVEGSSNFSKRIFEKLGFQIFAEIDYEDYKVDGKVMINNAGEHK